MIHKMEHFVSRMQKAKLKTNVLSQKKLLMGVCSLLVQFLILLTFKPGANLYKL